VCQCLLWSDSPRAKRPYGEGTWWRYASCSADRRRKDGMELRVHGIGSHEPFQVLGSPTLEFGDDRNGSYRMFEPSRNQVHAFVWSRTTRAKFGVYRYLLLPFTLLNVAGFAQSLTSAQDRLGGFVYRFLVQALGISVTVSYVYWLWAALADVPRVHGASAVYHNSATWLVLLIVLAPLLFRSLFPGRDGDSSASGQGIPPVGTSQLWTKRPTRSFHLAHFLGTFGLIEAINLATGWRQDLLLTLVVIQMTILLLGGAVILWRIPNSEAPERAGLVVMLLAIALPHVIFGSVLLADASVIERFHQIEPAESVGLAVLRPIPYWQFIATYFVVALMAFSSAPDRRTAS